jgi:TldD protein
MSRVLSLPKIRFWEIREENTKIDRIFVWNKEVKEISNSIKNGTSVRVLYGNGFGFAHSSRKSADSLATEALEIAKSMDRLSDDKKKIFLGESVKDERRSRRKIDPENVDLSEKKDYFLDLGKEMMKDRKIKSSQISQSSAKINSIYKNSLGSEIKQDLLYTNAVCSLTAKEGGNTADYSDRVGEMLGYEVVKDFDKICHDARDKAIKLLKAKHAKGGIFPVVCDGALTDVFAHEAVGHASEADIVMQDDSCLHKSIGRRIADRNVNVVDSALDNYWGSYFYDDEGIKAQETYLIKNGVLKTHMHSRETAAIFGKKPTGNARAEDYSVVPIVRMSNTYIEKGDFGEDEMFHGIKKGFFLRGSKGGQVDTRTGDFQFNALYGNLIENGKLSGLVREVSLSGNTLKILKEISRISKNYEKGQPGTCGKNGQGVRVIGYNPRILIDRAVVGGI